MNDRYRIDDDWFTFWFESIDSFRRGDSPLEEWNHELVCTHDHCAYEQGPCKFHPVDCECSEGQCQID